MLNESAGRTGVVEAGTQGLNPKMRAYCDHMRPLVRETMRTATQCRESAASCRPDAHSPRQCSHARERVAVVMLMHVFVHGWMVHQPMQRRVQHVVAHEEGPESQRAVERHHCGQTYDGRRVPEEVGDMLGKPNSINELTARKTTSVTLILCWKTGLGPVLAERG